MDMANLCHFTPQISLGFFCRITNHFDKFKDLFKKRYQIANDENLNKHDDHVICILTSYSIEKGIYALLPILLKEIK